MCFVQELEKLASRKLRISAKETMKIAEKLYTQGYDKILCINHDSETVFVFGWNMMVSMLGLLTNQPVCLPSG